MFIRNLGAIMATVITLIVGAFGVTRSTASAATHPLTYTCQQQPCQNSQEFAVYDAYGNPIYSVGEYGGDGVYGDNRSVYAPGNVFNPVLVQSFASPATYAADNHKSTACKAPETWIEPHGIWYCTSAGEWALDIKIP